MHVVAVEVNKKALICGILAGIGAWLFFLLMLAFAYSFGVSFETSANAQTMNSVLSILTDKLFVWGVTVSAGVGFGGAAYLAVVKSQKEKAKALEQVRGFKEDLNEQRAREGKEPIL